MHKSEFLSACPVELMGWVWNRCHQATVITEALFGEVGEAGWWCHSISSVKISGGSIRDGGGWDAAS